MSRRVYEATVNPTGRQIEIAHGDQRATVVELGGALRSYEVAGRPRIDGYASDEMASGSRGQVLMPWPNRVAGGQYEFGGTTQQLPLNEIAKHNAIHGLVRYCNWTVATAAADRVTVAYTLYPQPGYPFTLALELTYALGASGLTVLASATNLGTEACPYGAGFHPYLRLDPDHIDSLELRSPGSEYYRSDENQIPAGRQPVAGSAFDFRDAREIGETQMDTAFTGLALDADGRATVELRDPATGDTVALWCDESYRYLMIFTGDALPDADRRRTGLAVEPMTCAPDAFRSGDGLTVLAPGEAKSGVWGITTAGSPRSRTE